MADAAVAQVLDTAATRRGEGRFAVVFVHGFLDDRHVWDGVVSQLDAPDFESVQIDLAGSGARADAEGPFDYDRFANDVGTVVDQLGKPFVMVGQSMGSAVAELVAAARPDRTMGLVLVAPVPLAGVGMPAEAIESFRGLGGDAEGQRALRKQLSVGMSDPDVERIVAEGARLRPDVVATLADCWNGGHPDGANPSRYKGPALVLTGAGDPFVTADAVSAGVAPRLPQAATVVVDGAGHWPHLEQASGVAARIGEFFKRAVAEFPADAGQGWTQAFADKTADGFAQTFAAGAVLEASALNRPAEGRDLVTLILATASGIYESLAFTHEASHGSRTYLEWEATALGGVKLSGITVLAKNEDGKIEHAAIHHRPLGALQKFSGELRRRLDGQVDPSYFHGS
ncbi:pimeloyl-ACP methyl ester carboxylesterase [Amycolatopsis echigonensis]|uniref:Pimeloyl-ACP methyl ester carboxylesterase n=1 Tax=Amycolatopsis echigonensis TaxID=2576905 RepID=A0A2N3X1J9_9PSEU|nr:alpha/beta hydrolase [Amycolatopsis niigatensis]PKW00004.1 pimeloyl-ACP methyl ester carboxylesterase [Amycolatopsis niigatensis]